MKVKIVLVLLVLFTSCKSTETIKNTHTSDTIYKSEVIKVDKPQLSEIIIEDICDSLGVLKPIFYTNTSSNVKTSLKSYQNTLKLEVNVDSIVNSKVNEYKSKLKSEKEVVTITKTRVPRWCWYNLILSIGLLLWIFKKPLLMLIKPI